MVAWQPASEADGTSDGVSGRNERYELEYRKTNHDSALRAAGQACWEKIHDIRESHATISGERSEVTSQHIHISLSGSLCLLSISLCFYFKFVSYKIILICCVSGLKFDSRFVIVRVRARNKTAVGEFSEPVAIETRGEGINERMIVTEL